MARRNPSLAGHRRRHLVAIVKPQVDHANRTVDETIHNVQPQINHAQNVADCIQTAAGDVDKIAACNR